MIANMRLEQYAFLVLEHISLRKFHDIILIITIIINLILKIKPVQDRKLQPPADLTKSAQSIIHGSAFYQGLELSFVYALVYTPGDAMTMGGGKLSKLFEILPSTCDTKNILKLNVLQHLKSVLLQEHDSKHAPEAVCIFGPGAYLT